MSLAAGNLGWTLGHNDFAPRGEETRYMALHVTLTGMRGLVAPPLTIALYHLLDNLRTGLGPAALLVPLLLVVARRVSLSRHASRAGRGKRRVTAAARPHNYPVQFMTGALR